MSDAGDAPAPEPLDRDVVDTVVIGGGVVGLAVARLAARAGCEPIVVEQETALGRHQSSRNSEVIHAGIYYPPGSLKARLCLAGKRRLYEYCAQRAVPYRRCGKLIVATSAQELSVLDTLARNAAVCGVTDLERISAAEARALEPELACHAALVSPSTGIVDSHALLAALQADAQDGGAVIALGTQVTAIVPESRGHLQVHTRRTNDSTDTHVVTARRVINAAAFGAQTIARTTLAAAHASGPQVPPRYLTKGTYFTVRGNPFSRLVYPVPNTASLGIHVTVDMGGEVRFGPDQQWVDEVDYTLDASRAAAFIPEIRRYFPGLADEALQPAYVGVRCKVQAPGQPMADFVVQGPQAHGIAGLVHLMGIESPGLTACLAIAEYVADCLAISRPADP